MLDIVVEHAFRHATQVSQSNGMVDGTKTAVPYWLLVAMDGLNSHLIPTSICCFSTAANGSAR